MRISLRLANAGKKKEKSIDIMIMLDVLTNLQEWNSEIEEGEISMTMSEEDNDWVNWESLPGIKEDVDEQMDLCNRLNIPIRLVRASTKDCKEYLIRLRWIGPDE